MANDANEAPPVTGEAQQASAAQPPAGSPNESSYSAANVAPEVDLPPTSEGGDDAWSGMREASLEDVAPLLSSAEPGAQQQQPQTAAQAVPPVPVAPQVAQPGAVPPAPLAQQPQAAPQVPPVQYQVQPGVQPVQLPAQEQSSAPTAPQNIPDVLQLFAQHAPAIESAIAASEYQLTQADRDALETDAVSHIPKLLARAQVASMKSTLHYVNNFLPGMIQETVGTLVRQQQAESSFLKDFPHLSDPKLRPEIINVGRALRASYPQMPSAEFTKLVGQVLSMRYPPQAGQPTQPGVQQRVQQIPFVPAVAQQRAPIPQAQQPIAGDDWFNGMAQSYDDQ
jgi:hypothetical protein